ncbi:HAD family hydrolase [Thiomicrolovo sp. ZZH C-3]
MKIAIFDVCDTLYSVNTSFEFLDSYFSGNRRYRLFRKFSRSFPGKLINYPLYRWMKYDLVRVAATRFLAGEDMREIETSSREFIFNRLVDKINPQTEALLHELREAGYRIVLMSGSYGFIVAHVADYFSADSFFASELESVEGRLTGGFRSDQLFTKKMRLESVYPQIDELIVVSDNKTDYDLLSAADKAYVVCNKKKDREFWEKRFPDSSKIRYLETYDA